MVARVLCSPVLLRLFALLFFCFSGCAHTYTPCVTKCGVHVFGANCATAQRAEERATRVLGHGVKDWTPGVVCEALRGWKVRVHDRVRADSACSARSWRLSQDTYLCVRGFTEDVTATIWVLDGDLVNNAYSHEVVHVVDSAVTGKAGHCDWQQRGVTDSVFLLTGDPDVPDEESECARRRLKDRIRLIEKQEAP